MHLYSEQFSESHDFPPVTTPSKILVIASTARSGSHMLGHSLYQTRSFGFPLEYANPVNIPEWKRRFNKLDFKEALKDIQKKRTSPNGVFSIKIHYPQIKSFGNFSSLNRILPEAYFILLTRENVIRQAVSLSIAKQTGVWISGQEAVNEKPEYDFEQVDQCLRETIQNNASWRYKLAISGCNYMEMSFESIRKDLSGSIKHIARFLDIEVDPSMIPVKPATRKQENKIKDEWIEKFLSDSDSNQELIGKTRNNLLGRFLEKVIRIS